MERIRTWLREREPLIPRRKLIDLIERRPFLGQERPVVPIIDRVAPEEAIEVVARSEWARKLAEGICGVGYVGLEPGTPEFEACVRNVSRRVAAKVLGLPPPRPEPIVKPPRPPRVRRR